LTVERRILVQEKQNLVASEVLSLPEECELESPKRTEDSIVRELVSSVCKDPAFARETDAFSVSTSAALKCAKGALFAICIEAAAGLFLYCIWQVWHAYR
jgi:hypothetical protein